MVAKFSKKENGRTHVRLVSLSDADGVAVVVLFFQTVDVCETEVLDGPVVRH